MHIRILLFLCCIIATTTVWAQDTATQKPINFLKKITVGGVFQARYTVSLNKDVDVNGIHHPDTDDEVVRNSFSLKRARIQMKAEVSDRLTAAVLVNLADFTSDPKGKVLENAYISYRWNDAIHFTIGQFRPSFGLEDLYPVDVVKSMDFSNQYYAFGSNGWQSFQLGISMFGSLNKKGTLPIKYAVSAVNGNNRNQPSDNDNGKLIAGRLELGKAEKIAVGLNGGWGNVHSKGVYAAGIDIVTVIPLAPKFDLELQSEYKRGNNHVLYYGRPDSLRIGPISKYQMGGIYVLPNFRYNINYKKLTSIEFSMRYEYFNEDIDHNGNARNTYIPMISLAFLKDYGGRIQLGMQIDDYKRDIPGTKTHTGNLMILQVQCRI